MTPPPPGSAYTDSPSSGIILTEPSPSLEKLRLRSFIAA